MPNQQTSPSPIEQVRLIGQLADLKEQHYEQTLLLAAMLELLIDKGMITRDELRTKLAALDQF